MRVLTFSLCPFTSPKPAGENPSALRGTQPVRQPPYVIPAVSSPPGGDAHDLGVAGYHPHSTAPPSSHSTLVQSSRLDEGPADHPPACS